MPGESILHLIAAVIVTWLAFKHIPATLILTWVAGIVIFLANRGDIPMDNILNPPFAYAGVIVLIGTIAVDTWKPWKKFKNKPSP